MGYSSAALTLTLIMLIPSFSFLQLESALDLFAKYYTERHSGRKLTWLLQQSRGELFTSYLKSRISFVVRLRNRCILHSG